MNKEGILKNKEVFEKWLYGATIQYYDDIIETWCNVRNNYPNWNTFYKYRVKPEPVVSASYRRYAYNSGLEYKGCPNVICIHTCVKGIGYPIEELETHKGFIKWIDNDWIQETISN